MLPKTNVSCESSDQLIRTSVTDFKWFFVSCHNKAVFYGCECIDGLFKFVKRLKYIFKIRYNFTCINNCTIHASKLYFISVQARVYAWFIILFLIRMKFPLKYKIKDKTCPEDIMNLNIQF